MFFPRALDATSWSPESVLRTLGHILVGTREYFLITIGRQFRDVVRRSGANRISAAFGVSRPGPDHPQWETERDTGEAFPGSRMVGRDSAVSGSGWRRGWGQLTNAHDLSFDSPEQHSRGRKSTETLLDPGRVRTENGPHQIEGDETRNRKHTSIPTLTYWNAYFPNFHRHTPRGGWRPMNLRGLTGLAPGKQTERIQDLRLNKSTESMTSRHRLQNREDLREITQRKTKKACLRPLPITSLGSRSQFPLSDTLVVAAAQFILSRCHTTVAQQLKSVFELNTLHHWHPHNSLPSIMKSVIAGTVERHLDIFAGPAKISPIVTGQGMTS